MANATLEDLFGDDLLLNYDASDSSSLWTDTGETTNATDGDTVLSWSPSSDSFNSDSLSESTNGPVYRSDYNSEGYPALEFTSGNSDVLGLAAASSPLTGTRRLVLCVYQWIASGTILSLGNTAAWARWFQSGAGTASTHFLMQASSGSVSPSDAVTAGRFCAALDFNQTFPSVDIGPTAGADDVNTCPTGLSDEFTVGALNTGSKSQYGSFALYEIALIDGTTQSFGQLLDGQRVLENKWGISSVGGVPQAPTGGGGGGGNKVGGSPFGAF